MAVFIAKKHYHNYAFQLIFYLILANLLLSVGFFLSVDRLQLNYQQQPDSPLCIIQVLFGRILESAH